MTPDLFESESNLVRLDLEDAEISWAQHVDLGWPAHDLLRELIDATPWRQESVTVYGKAHPQPRLTAWYGDAGRRYAYSGLALEPLPWTPTLDGVRAAVQDLTHERFNSVLLNLYRDHRDRIGLHSDSEKELGPRPVIASVSLGATRTLVFRHKTRTELKPVRLALPSGSLLLMQGPTQTHWKHGIDPQSTPCGPRVNLTFRQIVGP